MSEKETIERINLAADVLNDALIEAEHALSNIRAILDDKNAFGLATPRDRILEVVCEYEVYQRENGRGGE